MKTPIDAFFKLGDKVTKGDPIQKAAFDYYLLWVMFGGFLTILITNVYRFIVYQSFQSLGWSFVMMAILWFQYYGLKAMYDYRKILTTKIHFSKDSKEILKEFEELKP